MYRFPLLGLMLLPMPAQAEPLPAELDCIPRNAAGFISVRGDLWNNETLKPVRDFIEKDDPALLKRLQTRCGFSIDEVARVTLLFPTYDPVSTPLVFVTLKKPYDKAKLLTKIKATSNRIFMPTMSKPIGVSYPKEMSKPSEKPALPPGIRKGGDPLKFEKTAPKGPDSDEQSTSTKVPPGPAKKEIDEPQPKPEIDPEDQMFNVFRSFGVDLSSPFFYMGPTDNLVVCFNENTLLFLPKNPSDGGKSSLDLLPLLLRPGKKALLEDALLQAAGDHALVIGGNVAGLPKSLLPAGPIAAALEGAQSVTLTADLAREFTVSVRVGYTDSAAALAAKTKVVDLMESAKEALPSLRKSLSATTSGELAAALSGPIEMLLAGATIRQKETVIEVTASVKVDETFTQAVEKILAQVKIAQQRVRSQNNLKQIGLACLSYESSFRTFPFPGWDAKGPVDEKRQAKISWRVAILPFLGEGELYYKFNMQEPWDSEHNKKLIPLMPKVYAPVNGVKAPKGETFYQIFKGPSALHGGMSVLAFKDGSFNTITVAESADSVVWTQPEDMLYDPNKPLPKLGGLFGGNFNVVMCDGSVRWIPKTISEKKLRALITPAGGEDPSEE